MTIRCLNPDCEIEIAGDEGCVAQAFVCAACGLQFVWPSRHLGCEGFVIYDLETTGLNPDQEDFIQIAAIRFRKGQPVAEEAFFSYAKPRRRISGFITDYMGITNDDVREAPAPCDVLVEFSRFVGSSTLIAHNGLRFDSKFLSATCLRSQRPKRVVPSIDSIWLSKAVFGNQRGIRHGLDIVVSRLGILDDGIRRHDARGDVELLGHAVSRMWQHLRLSHDAAGFRRHETCLPVH